MKTKTYCYSGYPAGRVVTPEEVAEVIAFLASEESSGVNGEAITVALGVIW
jgi:NAD(P)-dependent dehydrogenase (short-subunit alcohol dehydrogenase family)